VGYGHRDEIPSPLEHGGDVSFARFSPDGMRVVTICHDKSVRLWDVNTGKETTPPLKHASDVYEASFGPDGKRLVTIDGDIKGRVWEAATGDEIAPLTPLLKVSDDPIFSASFTSDGKYIVTRSMICTRAMLWDAATGKELKKVYLGAD
jgi:WD40 repeat protein